MERDELLQRYHEVRLLLEDLVAAWRFFCQGAPMNTRASMLSFTVQSAGPGSR